jgi:hypothetical protein
MSIIDSNLNYIHKTTLSVIDNDQYYLDFISNILDGTEYKEMNIIRLNNCIDQQLTKDNIINFITQLENIFIMYSKNIKHTIEIELINHIKLKSDISLLLQYIINMRKDYFSKCFQICHYFNKVNNHSLKKNIKHICSKAFENIIFMEKYDLIRINDKTTVIEQIDIIDYLNNELSENKNRTIDNLTDIYKICNSIFNKKDIFSQNIINDDISKEIVYKIDSLLKNIYDKIVLDIECDNYNQNNYISIIHDYINILIKYPSNYINIIYGNIFKKRFINYWMKMDNRQLNKIISIETLLIEMLSVNTVYLEISDIMQKYLTSLSNMKKEKNVIKYLDNSIWNNSKQITFNEKLYDSKTTIISINIKLKHKYTFLMNLIHYTIIQALTNIDTISFDDLIRKINIIPSELNIELNSLISIGLVIKSNMNFKLNKEYYIKVKKINLIDIDYQVAQYINSKLTDNDKIDDDEINDDEINDDEINDDEIDKIDKLDELDELDELDDDIKKIDL